MNDSYMTKIVAASLLADGGVYIPKDGSINAHYRQNKLTKHMDYVDWLVERLETICKTRKHIFQPKMKNAGEQVEIRTCVHPFYTKFRNRMYPNGHKVVDPHYLTFIDYEFLAIWYMEDGTLVKHKHTNKIYPEVLLCTDSFSYGEQHLLRKALKEKLDLDFNVRSYWKNDRLLYRLSLRSKDYTTFIENITPFILPTFSYKVQYAVSPVIMTGEDIVRSLQ